MVVNVHRIRPSDGAALRTIRLRALRDTPSAFGSTFDHEATLTDADWTDRAARGADGPDRATFLAHAAEQIVGVAGGYREKPGSAVVELVSMWVAPHARRQGVAAALVQTVINWSAATGASRVDLWVTRGNEPALGLYTDLGFKQTTDVQPLPSDPCKEELRMTLDLASRPELVSGDGADPRPHPFRQ